MLKRIAGGIGLALVTLGVVAGILYLAGVRVVLDGGGMPRLEFAQSADEQAEAIARHREAQRQAAPPVQTSSPSRMNILEPPMPAARAEVRNSSSIEMSPRSRSFASVATTSSCT